MTAITPSHPTANNRFNHENIDSPPHRKRSKKTASVKDLNLTAMLDVCFQLLIFFVLTVNFTVDEGYIRADLPKGGTQLRSIADPPKTKTKILLKAADVSSVELAIQNPPIHFDNGQPFQDLFTELRSMGPRGSGLLTDDSPMIISPMQDVLWTHVVATFNACLRAKYTDIRFAEAPPTP